jgi:hypothetical protein
LIRGQSGHPAPAQPDGACLAAATSPMLAHGRHPRSEAPAIRGLRVRTENAARREGRAVPTAAGRRTTRGPTRVRR